jgi:hypothetical protein
MPAGQLYVPKLLTTPGTDVLCYQAPTNVVGSITVNICNQNATNVKISVSLVPTGTTVAPVNFLEKDLTIYGNESYRLTVVISNQQSLYVRGDTVNVSVNVFGFEEPVS